MTAIHEGRICIVKKGRRAGTEVAVTKVTDGNFVMASPVSGKGKERKYAISHLEPTANKK
jgi:ribosomal protein L14E/L6E/L27E